ncbi:hypothetical protein D6D05_10076, partial [Aureobasidium pullulans]
MSQLLFYKSVPEPDQSLKHLENQSPSLTSSTCPIHSHHTALTVLCARMQSCYQSLLLAVQATGSSSQDLLLAIKRDRNKSTWRSESISRQRQVIT